MRHNLTLKLALSLVLVTGAAIPFVGQSASAQGVLGVPQVNPAQQAPSPTELSLPEEQKKENRTYPGDNTDIEDVKIDVPEPPPVAKIQSPQFFVNDIRVTGITIFKPEDIEPIVTQYKQKDLTLDQLSGLVDEINQKYREAGYLTTQAFIPPQDIENGVVTIEVLEGKIGRLYVSGNKYYKTWFLEKKIPQEPGEPLNIKDLEKTLNRINQQENFRLKAVLSPGQDTGETDLKLEVAERQPWQIAGTFDNQGRPFIGMYRYGVEVTNQNFTGIGDRVFAKWIGASADAGAKDTNVIIAGYTLPISTIGTELGYNFSYSRVNVDLPQVPQGTDVRGTSFNHSILLTQPLDKLRRWTVDAGVNFRAINSYSNIARAAFGLDNQDRIFSTQFGLSYDNVDRWGRTFARGQFTFAPHALGGEEKFSKYEMFFNRVHRLPMRNTLILRAYSQLTPDALPPAEQYQIGGAFSVRGFTEGLLTGDRGWSFGVEDRFPIPFLRHVSPYLADRVQGAVFFDYGQAWLDQSNTSYVDGISGSAGRTLLMSVGTGVRARITRFASGFVDLAWGLVDRNQAEPTAQPTFRVHFGIRSELLPDTMKTHDMGDPVEIKTNNERVATQNTGPYFSNEQVNAVALDDNTGHLGNDGVLDPVSLDANSDY